ncbi:potassium voltage-gated channel subfamily H member 7-like isoform X3 [Uranotaenia lowii]|uniref:potassium voltage-gated channel subfamily H member 7-like isoform X3 n=1 Tax=Uranotaenia lowii TaxID=190385 RepID=UPI00247AFC6E|nr:potassium voltage-gated channel subfamily H member 7-like isoform X3 [Uranotaenia lowii]
MPVRRGHVAPKTTLIETIIRKFDTHNRSFLVANAQPESCHIIFCSDGFCKMTGFTRAEVMQRSASTEFLQGQMTSPAVIKSIKEALRKGEEKHFEILYYRKDGSKFLCSEVIAPIRSEVDDISLFIINFEDLTNPSSPEPLEPVKQSKFDRARASFRQSFRIGHIALRDRGLRLAGYLTPPSDATQEEEEIGINKSAIERGFCSDQVSQTTVLKVETNIWTPMSTPALARARGELEPVQVDVDTLSGPGEIVITTPQPTKLEVVPVPADLPTPITDSKPEFQQTKSLDFDIQSKPLHFGKHSQKIYPENTKLIQSYESTHAKNSRGLIEKRAHTIDDFMRGPRGHTVRQYFPYVSSESDLQRYKAVPFKPNAVHEPRTSSSLSNVPSDSTKTKDNGSAKFFQGTRQTINMGEKVAQQAQEKWSSVRLSSDAKKSQVKVENHISTHSNLNLNGLSGDKVLSLGADVLPEYKLQSPRIHKWTILHYSPFKAVWDWIILILVMYTAIFTPYVAAFLLGEPDFNQRKNRKYADDPIVIIDLIVDVTFVIDILINFRTTFVNGQDEVVSHPGRIAVHYLSGWFLIDLVAAIPFDLLLVGSDTDELGLDKDETTTLIGLLKTARLLRLVRVARKIDRYSEYGAAVLVLLMATFALIAHWLACIWYAIGNAERPFMKNKIGWLDALAEATQEYYYPNNTGGGPSIKSRYVTALYFTFTSLTSVGFGNVAPNTDAEKIFTICVMLVGSLMYASIFGNVSAIIQRLYSGTARYHTQMLRVREFIRFHQIPNPLRQRLEEYFQHAWSYTNGIDMNSVLKGFPECLQADICLHLNRNLLNNCSAFIDASPGCLRALSLKFKTTHAPPGDTLVHKGDVLTHLYFIARGSIEILKDDVVMAILGKDDIFGENPCIHTTLGKSNSNVKALTYCDLHKIHRDDLLDVLDLFPEFYDSFVNSLEITYNMRDEEQAGIELRHRHMRLGSQDRDSDSRSYVRRLHTVHHQRTGQTKCDIPNDRSSGQISTNFDDDRKFSISGMMSQIKRSIPDLRSNRHQPLTSTCASPNESPKSSHKHSPPSDLQSPKDTVTLSAISQRGCACGPKDQGGGGGGGGPGGGSMGAGGIGSGIRPVSISGPVDLSIKSPEEDAYQHMAPHVTTGSGIRGEGVGGSSGMGSGSGKDGCSEHTYQRRDNVGSVTNQLSDLTIRLDNLEGSLKKDIRTILDILHQQQQMQLQFHQQQLQHQHQMQQQAGKTALSSYQPSESDFSFDMCPMMGPGDAVISSGGVVGMMVPAGGMGPGGSGMAKLAQAQQRTNVQRSVSQPECANEKSLFKCSKFSSFNQAMDDAPEGHNWNIFAPIAKLESLDEIDQDSKQSISQDKPQ